MTWQLRFEQGKYVAQELLALPMTAWVTGEWLRQACLTKNVKAVLELVIKQKAWGQILPALSQEMMDISRKQDSGKTFCHSIAEIHSLSVEAWRKNMAKLSLEENLELMAHLENLVAGYPEITPNLYPQGNHNPIETEIRLASGGKKAISATGQTGVKRWNPADKMFKEALEQEGWGWLTNKYSGIEPTKMGPMVGTIMNKYNIKAKDLTWVRGNNESQKLFAGENMEAVMAFFHNLDDQQFFQVKTKNQVDVVDMADCRINRYVMAKQQVDAVEMADVVTSDFEFFIDQIASEVPTKELAGWRARVHKVELEMTLEEPSGEVEKPNHKLRV